MGRTPSFGKIKSSAVLLGTGVGVIVTSGAAVGLTGACVGADVGEMSVCPLAACFAFEFRIAPTISTVDTVTTQKRATNSNINPFCSSLF